jgi:hypothetical protein
MTRCESCGRETATIRGLCPHCGHLKDERFAPPPSKIRGGSLWPDDFTTYVVGFAVLSLLGGVAYAAIESLL